MRLDHLLSKEEEVRVVVYCLVIKAVKSLITFLVAMRLRVTPVPIPNTMVKPQAADGTSLETVRESRWPPDLEKEHLQIRCECSGDYSIDTGNDEQQLITANLISRAVLLL